MRHSCKNPNIQKTFLSKCLLNGNLAILFRSRSFEPPASREAPEQGDVRHRHAACIAFRRARNACHRAPGGEQARDQVSPSGSSTSPVGRVSSPPSVNTGGRISLRLKPSRAKGAYRIQRPQPVGALVEQRILALRGVAVVVVHSVLQGARRQPWPRAPLLPPSRRPRRSRPSGRPGGSKCLLSTKR